MTSLDAVSAERDTRTPPMDARCVLTVIGALAVLAAAACGSDSTAPVDPLTKVPDFLYVSNASGNNQLYTWKKGVTALFPGTVAGDVEPQSAAGKVVFTSYRVSYLNAEIYIANLDGSNALRLTTYNGPDEQPSLSPDGNTVVFTSFRSGTSRIWSMGADGSSPTAVNTGSADDVPESHARYSPGGGRLLLNSPRTGTSQIWVVPLSGTGSPVQVTHEANGAFNGSWSPDGNSIYYVDGTDRTKIHNVVVASGVTTDYVTNGIDVGDASCTTSLCLVVSRATSSNGDIDAYIGAGSTPLPILITSNNEFEPAILH